MADADPASRRGARSARSIPPSRRCAPAAEEARHDARISPVARERIAAMHGFVVTMDDWYQQMMAIPASRLMLLVKMGKRVLKFLPKGKAD